MRMPLRVPLRVLLRAAALAATLLLFVVAALLLVLVPHAHARRALRIALVRRTAAGVLRALGIARRMRGPTPRGPALLAANHRSWLDIVACLASWRCTFVAKREVAAWPIVGPAARAIGVVFIDRTRPRDLVRVLAEVERALRDGRLVVLFPEATTTAAAQPLPFRSGLLESLVRTGCVAFPLALVPSAHPSPTDPLAWVGSESLVANLARLLRRAPAQLTLHVGAPVTVAERKRAARELHGMVSRRLGVAARDDATVRPAASRPAAPRPAVPMPAAARPAVWW
jgi:1-acyl-sn-glycerol-3-phosphate acyltransferase